MSKAFVSITGKVGQVPQLRTVQTNSGQTSVCDVSLAINPYVGNNQDGSRKDGTVWLRVALWGKDAEIAAQYLQKGSQPSIMAEIQGLDTYQHPQSGEIRPQLRLRAVPGTLVLPPRSSNGDGGDEGFAPASTGGNQPVSQNSTVSDDDIPF